MKAGLGLVACLLTCACGARVTVEELVPYDSGTNDAAEAIDTPLESPDADTCADGKRDGDETDVDCGGSCAPCATGRACRRDADCLSSACDAASLTCAATACTDHRKDRAETDVDCGGGTCPPCALANRCHDDTDCVTLACDTISHTCLAGGACSACGPGKHCKSNFDCVAGHFCNGTKVCQ